MKTNRLKWKRQQAARPSTTEFRSGLSYLIRFNELRILFRRDRRSQRVRRMNPTRHNQRPEERGAPQRWAMKSRERPDRSSFIVVRSLFCVHRSALIALLSSLFVYCSALIALRSSFSHLRLPLLLTLRPCLTHEFRPTVRSRSIEIIQRARPQCPRVVARSLPLKAEELCFRGQSHRANSTRVLSVAMVCALLWKRGC